MLVCNDLPVSLWLLFHLLNVNKMSKIILTALILAAVLCSCTKNDGEDDDRKIVIPPHPTAPIVSDSTQQRMNREDEDRRTIIIP
jgi:hypothetical protein